MLRVRNGHGRRFNTELWRGLSAHLSRAILDSELPDNEYSGEKRNEVVVLDGCKVFVHPVADAVYVGTAKRMAMVFKPMTEDAKCKS